MFWNASTIEVQKHKGIDHTVPASGFIADALDLIEESVVVAPELGPGFELQLREPVLDEQVASEFGV
jgi:hypothetical protein